MERLLKVSKKAKGTYLEDLIKEYNLKILTNTSDYTTLKSLRKEIADRRKFL